MSGMKIALAQLEAANTIEENLDKALAAIDNAADSGAQLVLFSEIHLSPFFPQYPKSDASPWRLNIDSEPVNRLRAKCAERSIIAAPNIYLSEGGLNYDATLMINADGELLGASKMVHIPQFKQFYEQDYYQPSDDGFNVFKTPFGVIGVIVCFDRHFPESFRSCVLQGADLILIPTVNTKAEPSEMFEWELRVAAMQNSVIVAMCNRVGVEGDMDFSGESIVVGVNGDVIAKADDQEQLLYAEISLNDVKSYREKQNYLALRRPEFYY